MAKATIRNFIKMIDKMQSEREELQGRIAELDDVFVRLGISPREAAPRRGRPPKRGPGRPAGRTGKRRGRRPGRPRKVGRPAGRRGPGRPPKGNTGKRYGVSGKQFLLDLIQAGGSEGVTSDQLTAKWSGAGRSGTPFNQLGLLVREGSAKKRKLRGRKGSTYTAK